MAEYIEREALEKVLTEKFQTHYGDTCYQFIHDFFRCTMRQIRKAPAADVVEVKHGEWISLTECANAGVYCSVCHKKVYKEDYAWSNKRNKVRSNYCPNCGAKMKG